MATIELWILALAVACVIYPDYAHGQFRRRFRRCTLPHERRAWFWERTEQYCSAGRTLEYRSRSQRCVCEPGYYRDEETNNCYDARMCGHCDSSKHERFNKCTNDCEAVCGKQVIQQCDKPCVPGCECMKGYIRKYKKGPCVPIQSCPPKCPAYMTFEMHRERCPRTCNVAREDSCSETNEGPGCACRKGFVLRAPFGTVRTRVWCIHESMCTFPDEVKEAGGRQHVEGSQIFKGSTAAANNSFWASNQGRRGVQEPMPKGTDEDLFLGGKGFPPIGNLAHLGDQRKLGIENGEIVQGKIPPGDDEQWRWNLRQQEHQGSLRQKIDQNLFQGKQEFPSLGGLVQKTDEGFNVGQEKLHLKGGQQVRGAGITGNVNLWGWNEGHRGSGSSVSKKMDKDLYRGVNQFSHLGYRSPKAGEGSQLRQQEVGFTGTYSGHGRGVSRRDRFWDWNNHQASLGNPASQQTGSNLYQGSGGFTAQGHLGYVRGQISALGRQKTGFEGGQMGQGQFQMQENPVQSTGQAPFTNLEETGFEGSKRMQVEATSASNNLWGAHKGQPEFQGTVPTGYDDTLSLGTKGYSPLGDMGNTRGQGSEMLRGSFMGSKHEGSSDQWKKTQGEQGHLGLGLGGQKGVQGVQGQSFDIDDWLSGQQQNGAMPDFTKGQEGDEGLVPTKIINTWTPDEGQLQKGESKKGGLPGSVRGASNLPGVGLPVGKLPELPKLDEGGAEGGIPSMGIPGGNISNILDILEAKVNAQKAINGPGQIQIISHGGSGAKGGEEQISKGKKTSAASSSGIKGGLTSSIKGASDVPGVGLPVGKLPELPKLGVNGGPGSIPGVELPAQNQQNILDILEAKVNSQKAISEPGQIEIIGHGGSGTKGGRQQISTNKRSAANSSGKKEGLTSSEKGAKNVLRVGPPLGGLPELPKVSGNGSPGGIPSVALPTVKTPNVLKTPEGKARFPKLSIEPGQIEILGHGGTGTKGGHLPGGVKQKAGAVDLTRQTKAINEHQTLQTATSALPVSASEISSLHFTGQGTQTRLGSTTEPSLIWTQQNELLSTPPEFERPNAAFPLPGANPASNYQQSESPHLTGQDRLSQQGNTVQPVSVEWKQQKQSLSGFLQLHMEKGQFPLSGANVASNNQQPEITRFEGQVWQQRHTDTAEPGSTVRMQGDQQSSGVSQYRRATAPGPLSGGSIVSTNEPPDSPGLAGHGWQILEGNTAQPTAAEWTQEKKHLSGISHFRRATASLPQSSATVGSANKQPVSTDFIGQGRRARFGVMAQPGLVEWTQNNEPFSGTSQLQTGTPSAPLLGTTVVPSIGQPENTDFTRSRWRRNYVNMEQPNSVYWTEQNKPLSGISEYQRVNAPYPLPYATVASNRQQTENAHSSIQGGRMLRSNTQQPGFVDWTHQNEPLADIPEYQRATASASLSGATAASTNQQFQSTDFTSHGLQTRHGNTVQPGAVEWAQENEPLLEISQFQKTKGSGAPSAWTFGSNIEQKKTTDFSGRNVRMHPSNTMPSSAVDQAQENKPVFVYRTFDRPTATVPLSGATDSSSNIQKGNTVFEGTLPDTGYGGATQTGVIDVTQQNTPLAQPTEFKSETALASLSNAASPLNQQGESRGLSGIYPQASSGSKTRRAAVGWMQQNQHFTRLPETPSARSSVPTSGASVVPTKQGQPNTHFTGNVFPIGQDSATQQGIIDWAEQQDALSMIPEFQSSTASDHLFGASAASTDQEKGSVDLTGKISQPVNENMKPEGAIDGTKQNNPQSKLPVLQSATASSASLLSATVTSGNEVKRTDDLTSEGSQVHPGSVAKTGVVESTQQITSISKPSKLKKEEAAVSLPGATASSGNRKGESQDIKSQGSQTTKDNLTQPSAVEGTHKNEVPKLHNTKGSSSIERPTVALKNLQNASDRLAKRDLQTHSAHTAQSSGTDRKEQKEALPKSLELQKAMSSPPLADSTRPKQESNKNNGFRGQESETGHGSTGQPGAQNVNAGERTEGVVDNQNLTLGQRIVHSGVHSGKALFDGPSNIWTFGGLFQHSMPTAGTGQPPVPVRNYPDGYGSYGAQGQPAFGGHMMPFGYPTVYPAPYVPMTNAWGQPNGVTDELQAQQQPVLESEIPASPTSLINQNAEKTEGQDSTPGVKGISVSGVPHKRTAGVASAAKNYAFDDSSLDSW
uniref:Putative bitil peptide n=1 Tax=Rhipicephalus pulchellus TaxID=72859 RepID=L7LRA8_RHIPC